MKEEMTSLYKNNTWRLVVKLIDKKVIGCKWVFKKKYGIPSVEPARFDPRVAANGFS